MCEKLKQRIGAGLELVVGHDPVDQAPVERLLRGDTLAEHRHLGGARVADPGRNEDGRTAVGDQADVDEGEQEVGGLGGYDQVAGERERAADPTAGPFTAATTGFGISRSPVMIGW